MAVAAPKIISLETVNITSLSPKDLVALRKNVMEIILFTKKFELSLSNLSKTKKMGERIWYEMDISIKSINDFESEIIYILREKPTDYIVNRVIEKNVQSSKLQYRSRINALKLLFGKNVNDETGEISNFELIPLDEYLEGPKKEIHEDPIESSEDSLNNVNPSAKDSKENPKKKNKIEPLESFLDKNMPLQKERKNRANQVAINKFDSPDLNLSKELPSEKETGRIPRILGLEYFLGFEKETIESINSFKETGEELRLDINLDRIVFNVYGNTYNKENYNNIRYGLGLSKNVGDNIYGVAPKINLNAAYLFNLYDQKWYLGGLVDLEKSGYVSVPIRGEGVQSIDTFYVWSGIESKVNFSTFGLPTHMRLSFKKSFMANASAGSNTKSVDLEGSRIDVAMGWLITKRLGIEFKYEFGNFTANTNVKLENNHNLTALRIFYN